MKKPLLILGIFLFSICFPVFLSGQCGFAKPVYRPGQLDLNTGVGFGSQGISSSHQTTFPLLMASLDYALRDDLGPGIIGVGGYLGVEGFKSEFGDGDYGWKYTSAIVQGRATYHYQFVEKLDTYAGLGLGFRVTSASAYGAHPTDIPEPDDGLNMVVTVFAGAKYFFTEKFAAFGELSVGVTLLTVGVSFRLQDKY